MAEGFTDLEKAIVTLANADSDLKMAMLILVSRFHAASTSKGSTLKVNEFKKLLSFEMPHLVPTSRTEAGFSELLRNMKLKYGEEITFKHLLHLIENVDTRKYKEVNQEESSCVIF
ncbi:protein S100-A4-like [Hoplias malabaricus]|uniref:protein S100-A4-like n=1 Tax=Hoplias malabaricus TaxID=27720 RepID=UPI003463151F